MSVPRLGPAELTQARRRAWTSSSKSGMSLVAGRAALVPAGDDPGYAAAQAAKAGASSVVLYGDALPGGGIGLDDGVTVPVVGLPSALGKRLADELAAGRTVAVSIGRTSAETSSTEGGVAPFSSRGLAFDGFVKPDLVAPGVGLLTADPARPRTARPATRASAARAPPSAIVAGSAALLAEARPDLDASALKGLLAGSARQLPRESVAAQGTGLLDIGATAAGEVAALPTTLSFGRATRGSGWHATRRLVVRNLSSRRLTVEFAADRRDRGGARASCSRSRRRRRGSGRTESRRSTSPCARWRRWGDAVEGLLTIRPRGSSAIHVPWLVTVAAAPRRAALVDPSRPAAIPSVRHGPAVLSFQAGGDRGRRAARAGRAARCSISGERRLEALGILAQLRDLLPGRYAFGLTGRDANGERSSPAGTGSS